MSKKYLNEINKSGWLDNQEIEYYIEQTGLPVTQEFIELIIENQRTMDNIERAVNLAAGIIKQQDFKHPLELALEIAKENGLEKEVEESYDLHMQNGANPEHAANLALWDWDL